MPAIGSHFRCSQRHSDRDREGVKATGMPCRAWTPTLSGTNPCSVLHDLGWTLIEFTMLIDHIDVPHSCRLLEETSP